MAGTSKTTKPVAVRLPVDLVEWATTQGDLKVVIARALRALKEGHSAPPPAAGPDPRIAELEAENARLRRDQQTAVAKAALSPGQAETVVGRHRHLGNPLQPTTGLPVGGMAIGFNLKGGSNAHGDKKSGR